MGRKQQRLCFGLRLLALIPVAIVLAPSVATLRSWYGALVGLPTAETIFINGVMWTGDPSLSWADSMAVSEGRILGVGTLSQAKVYEGPGTQYVDLGGRFVTPGFIDSHVHFISSGLKLTVLNLRDVKSRLDFTKSLQEAAKGAEKGSWIFGDGWNNNNWGGELPDVSWIDDVTPDNPVWVARVDGHMGLANSIALSEAQINSSTPSPVGGYIIKNREGDPTGVLVDDAMPLVVRLLPEATVEDRRQGLRRACELALSQGITSVVDFGAFMPGFSPELSWSDLDEVYLWSDAKSMLAVRVNAFLPLQTWSRVVGRVKKDGRILSQWLRIGGVKAFADGSLGSSSALFHEPYLDDPSNYGAFVVDPDWLLEEIVGADKYGLQIAVHVIGDAAVDKLLTMVHKVNTTNGPRDRRFRLQVFPSGVYCSTVPIDQEQDILAGEAVVEESNKVALRLISKSHLRDIDVRSSCTLEHVQHLSSGGPSRVAASGVIASVQPMHLLDDAVYVREKLGEKRTAEGSYLFRSLLSNGTLLALGSDWNVAPLDALRGMDAAVRRTPAGWNNPFIESETIAMEAALRGYTVDAAYAAFMEEDVGSLRPGKLADFVVLSDNLLKKVDSNLMPRVDATFVGGIQQYASSSWPGSRPDYTSASGR